MLPVAEIMSFAGDASTVALVMLFWRFDRRLLTVEIESSSLAKNVEEIKHKVDSVVG